MIRVLVNGACGKMGQDVIKAVTNAENMEIVGAVDIANVGQDIGTICGIGELGVLVTSDTFTSIKECAADVMVDFTRPDLILNNIKTAIKCGINAVVGTTGLTAENIAELEALNKCGKSKIFIAPNFAIGAVLMMEFSKIAAKQFEWAEVIEFHHEKKLDAPSGTALRTAELIRDATGNRLSDTATPEHGEESRGMAKGNVRVHAVRMPGVVADQEVIFGGLGQTLTISHKTINRESFMPGVVLAISKVDSLSGIVIGLEKLLDL